MQKRNSLRQIGPPIQHNGIAIRVDTQGKKSIMPMFLFTLTGKVPVHVLLEIEEAEQFYRELGQVLDSVQPKPKGKDEIPW